MHGGEATCLNASWRGRFDGDARAVAVCHVQLVSHQVAAWVPLLCAACSGAVFGPRCCMLAVNCARAVAVLPLE